MATSMDQAIKDYTSQVLAGSWSDAEKAQMIRDQAAKVGVTPEQISAATGYSLDNVNAYMALAPAAAPPTRPSSEALSKAEQEARQAWLDGKSVPKSATDVLFATNPDGTMTRWGTDPNAKAGDMYGDVKTPYSMYDVKTPEAKQYYLDNPSSFYANATLKDGFFKAANVRGPNKPMGQLNMDELYQAYMYGGAFGTGYDANGNFVGPGRGVPPSSGGLGAGSIGGSVSGGGTSPIPGGILSSVVGGGTSAGGDLPSNALIQGRLNALLSTDSFGNYTNPVVRQAAERAMQAFAGRGLLNSSMAIQAAQEAAIAKAIEIAGPDAQRVFDNLRGDKDWAYRFEQDRLNNAAEIERARILANLDLDKLRAEYGYRADADSISQAFNLRQNYVNSIANITNNYQQMVNNINQSGMRPEDKQAALADAAATRDAEAAYINDLYSKMPGWQQAWLSPAVPTRGVDINTITNVSTLRNIIADPAQPQAIRDAAQARLNQMLQQQAAQQPSGGLLNTTPEPNYA